MTLNELRAASAALTAEAAAILEAAEARFTTPDDTVEVRGAFVLDADGNPTDQLDANVGLTEQEISRSAEIAEEQATLAARIARGEGLERAAAAGHVSNVADFHISPMSATEDAHDQKRASKAGVTELRGMLATALERSSADDSASHQIEATIAKVRKDSPTQERGLLQFAIATSNDDYRSAFGKVLANESHMVTDVERAAMTDVMEARATITIATGLSFPIDIDPTMIHTGSNPVHPWRQLASVRSGTAGVHKVNVLAGSTFAMRADGGEVAADNTPADSSVSITAQTMSGLMTYTDASAADMPSLIAELGIAAAEAIGVLENAQFTNGTAVAPQVEGFTDGAVITRVSAAAIDTLKEADLLAAYNALPSRYRANASWQMSNPGFNDLRQLENTAGFRVGIAQDSVGAAPGTLLGLPWYENSLLSVPSAPTVWVTGENGALIADFNACYRVYDVVGSATVENIPHMMGANQRPLGTRGVFVNVRMGAGIINADAGRIIDIT